MAKAKSRKAAGQRGKLHVLSFLRVAGLFADDFVVWAERRASLVHAEDAEITRSTLRLDRQRREDFELSREEFGGALSGFVDR
jgi:hypothetical protein